MKAIARAIVRDVQLTLPYLYVIGGFCLFVAFGYAIVAGFIIFMMIYTVVGSFMALGRLAYSRWR